MTGVKISQLPLGGDPLGSDLFPVARENDTYKIRIDSILPIEEKNLSTSCVSNRAISANAVSFDKIVSIPGNTVLGNNSPEISNASPIQVSTDMIENEAITSSKIRQRDIKTINIANDAVTYYKMQNISTANRVLGSTVSNGVISETQVVEEMLADNSITSQKIKQDGVKEFNVSPDAITRSKIKNNEVIFSKIQQIGTLTNRVIGYKNAHTDIQALKVTPDLVDTNFGLIPRGGIIMWSGTINTIPTGWALCNGQNGTPDLRDRFIVGASNDVLGEARTSLGGTITKTGGGVSHSHDLSVGSITISRVADTDVTVTLSDISATSSGGVVNPHVLTEEQIPAHNHNTFDSTTDGQINFTVTGGGHNHGSFVTDVFRTGGTQFGSGENYNIEYNSSIGSFNGVHSHSGSFNLYKRGNNEPHSHGFTNPSVTVVQPEVSVSISQPAFEGEISGISTVDSVPPYFAIAFIMKL